jgi:hypothetical protein
MKSVLAKVTALFLPVLLAHAPVFGQAGHATAEIKGSITDPSGALVPDAIVTAIDAARGLNRTTTSDERGEYALLSLAPGSYQVRVEKTGFASQLRSGLELTVGETATLHFVLNVGQALETITVTSETPLIETERTQQSNTIAERYIRNLPIDRRDYLSYALLAPGIADSDALADNADSRPTQTPQSGLSFYGSNGRGNSVSVDGAQADDIFGGVRATVSQEAVQEFQINRSNYSAEFGGASGGVVNIISKSGTNDVRGSVFGFFRHQRLDAAPPFAIVLDEAANTVRRIKPDSDRQQFGGAIGFPIIRDRTFFFGSYEGLRRRESSAVPVLTDLGIFQPTQEQAAVLDALAASSDPTPVECLVGAMPLPRAACATELRAALTAKPSTEALFRANSGVFPLTTDSHGFSLRIDHRGNDRNQLFLRYNFTDAEEGNQRTRALVGFSRSNNVDVVDSNLVAGWTHIFNPSLIHDLRLQGNYRKFYVLPNELNGPEFNITGFGFFNRDFALPSRNIERHYDAAGTLSYVHGRHHLKFGAQVLIRDILSENDVFFGGRFNFGSLPGALLSPELVGATLNALQAFDQGLPQFYQVGFGDPALASTIPFYAAYVQDSFKIRPNVTLQYGLRYELDDRTDPVPTDRNNFAPRIGFSWAPGSNNRTIVRGGYGIFYAPHYYQIDHVTNALNEIDGFRQIAQVLTTLTSAPPPAVNGPVNIFQTLLAQGRIGVPNTVPTVTPADLAQFGITVAHTGPRPPLTVLFRIDPNYRNAYSQQANFAIERELTAGLSASINYIFAHTLKITRARDINVLPRPVGPQGIAEWTAASGCAGAALSTCFRDPALLQENLYESSAQAFYHGMIVEMQKRFARNFALGANYTLSKAIDEVTDFNSDFKPNDQTNARLERALSGFDQRHKMVVYAYLESPYRAGSGQGLIRNLLADFTWSPVFRYNSARPFNLLAGVDVNGDRSSTSDRPAFAGRNTGIGPDFWTVDMRVTRRIEFRDGAPNLELSVEAFNLFNRLNFSSVNNTVGPNFTAPFHVKARRDLGPSQPLGFTSAFDPRRIQLGFRLSF